MTARRKGGAKGVFEVRVEAVVDRKPAAAWRAFTRDLRSWWPEGFATRTGARMVLEPRVGGRLREDWGRGGGLSWYTVESVDPGRRLLLAGDLTADYGGPARSHVEITFEEAAGGTRVRLRDMLFAGADRKLAANMEAGWKVLLVDSFARWCAK